MNLSFKQYRAIDLGILLFLAVAAEAVTRRAAIAWFPYEAYVLSPTFAMLCIVMMRWDGFAAIHAVACGLTLCIASGADARQFAVYCIGNCFALAAMVMFKVCGGKDKVRGKFFTTALFVAVTFCLVQIGRWLVWLPFGGSLKDIVGFFVTDLMSLLFAELAVLIARRVDGLFEDQMAYLIRTQSERNKQQLPDFAGDTEYGEDSDLYK